jgi:hypothetical protein
MSGACPFGAACELVATRAILSGQVTLTVKSEADGRDHEQIHGGNVRSVVSQEGAPPLTGRAMTLDHVLCMDRPCGASRM